MALIINICDPYQPVLISISFDVLLIWTGMVQRTDDWEQITLILTGAELNVDVSGKKMSKSDEFLHTSISFLKEKALLLNMIILLLKDESL